MNDVDLIDTGILVPARAKRTARMFSADRQSIEVRKGVTGTLCGVCRAFTALYHESTLPVGTSVKESHQGYFDDSHTWRDVYTTRYVKLERKFWVCADCYSSRVGKPVIPSRPHPEHNVTRENYAERQGRKDIRYYDVALGEDSLK